MQSVTKTFELLAKTAQSALHAIVPHTICTVLARVTIGNGAVPTGPGALR